MKLFLEIIYNFGILIAISIIAGFVFQKVQKRLAVEIIQGILFGTAALIGMLNPVVVAPGLIFDGRSVMISLAGLFYGPVAAIISATMALVLRLSQGGTGAKIGISVITASAIIGTIFYYKWILKSKKLSEKHLLLFGFIVHIAMLICTVALPTELILNTLNKIWISVLVVYPLAGVIIGRVLLDASDHWQTKRELESSEEKFRLMVKNASDVIVILEADGTQRYVSPAAEKITGFRICELQGRSMQEIIHPDDMPHVMELWMQLLANPDHMPTAQYRHIHKTKGWVYLEAVGQNFLAEPAIKGIVTSVRDISERKVAEAALKESEEKFRILAESTPTAIMIYQNNKWIYANQAALDMTEYSENEIYQMQFWDFVHPDDQQRIKNRGQSRQKGVSGINRDEMRIVSKSGKTKWMNLTGASAVIKGMPAGIVSVIDITERKKAENELIINEEKTRLLLDLAPDAFFQGDNNGDLIGCNNRAIDITGYSKEELIGKNISALFSEKILSHKPLNYEALKQGAILKIERELLCKDGSILPIEMCSKQMPDGTYQSFFRDISERKLAEEALLNEKEQLSVTLRSIGDGVITTDTDGTIIMLNSVAEEMTGWNQENAAGKALNLVFNIINEASGKPCDNPVAKVLQTGQIQELANHTILISRDGSRRIIGDSGAPIKDQSGKIFGVVLVFRDMTEKYKLLEAAQQSQKLDSIGILAGGIAHDFNNLLGGIFGYIGLAKAQSNNESTIELLDKAHNAIERAKNLTHQLLTFAKGGEPIKTNQELSSFIKETVQFALSGSAISVRFELPDTPHSANIDRNQIAQVIDNIVINAIESMPNCGIITVSVNSSEQKQTDHPLLINSQYVKITISDQGSGIPKEIINHIFDPFFTTKSSGHGLGLAMSYSIIRKHEGIIEVESEPGKGSSFSIFLPAAPHLEIIAEQTTSQKTQKACGRILVMDDEPMLREIISEILKACGYEVAAVADGESAVRLFTEEKNAGRPFKAVIFDLTIPGAMGGKEAIAQIRKIDQEVPAFVSSGYSVDPVVANPREFGFWGSIPKPFTFSELKETLNKYLNT